MKSSCSIWLSVLNVLYSALVVIAAYPIVAPVVLDMMHHLDRAVLSGLPTNRIVREEVVLGVLHGVLLVAALGCLASRRVFGKAIPLIIAVIMGYIVYSTKVLAMELIATGSEWREIMLILAKESGLALLILGGMFGGNVWCFWVPRGANERKASNPGPA